MRIHGANQINNGGLPTSTMVTENSLLSSLAISDLPSVATIGDELSPERGIFGSFLVLCSFLVVPVERLLKELCERKTMSLCNYRYMDEPHEIL